MVTHLQCAGLPHSEIAGSKPVCSSPTLIAAYHVLHRLQKPRHPPFALVTFSLNEFLWITSQVYVYTLDLTFTRCLEIAVHNISIDSLSFNFCYRLINFFFFYYLVIFSQTCQWTVIWCLVLTTVVSQMGCKDTDFFLSSKFFCDFFAKIFTFYIIQLQNTLIIRGLHRIQNTNPLIISELSNLSTALWGARGRLNTLRGSDIR